jgi:hypothetical protein
LDFEIWTTLQDQTQNTDCTAYRNQKCGQHCTIGLRIWTPWQIGAKKIDTGELDSEIWTLLPNWTNKIYCRHSCKTGQNGRIGLTNMDITPGLDSEDKDTAKLDSQIWTALQDWTQNIDMQNWTQNYRQICRIGSSKY